MPKEEGYSHELISVDSYKLTEGGKTDLDKLESEPYPGIDTIFKAMKNNLKRYPDTDLLGTPKKGGVFEWLTWR